MSAIDDARVRAIKRIEKSMAAAAEALGSEGDGDERIEMDVEDWTYRLGWIAGKPGTGFLEWKKGKGRYLPLVQVEVTAETLLAISVKALSWSRAIIQRIEQRRADREAALHKAEVEEAAAVSSFDAIVCGHKDCEDHPELAEACMLKRLEQARAPVEALGAKS